MINEAYQVIPRRIRSCLHVFGYLHEKVLVHAIYGTSTINVDITWVVSSHEAADYDWFISYMVVVATIPLVERECANFPLHG